jgi:hypothetical protein
MWNKSESKIYRRIQKITRITVHLQNMPQNEITYNRRNHIQNYTIINTLETLLCGACI